VLFVCALFRWRRDECSNEYERFLLLAGALVFSIWAMTNMEERPPVRHLPFNPFAGARTGDWSAYIGSMQSQGLHIEEKATLIYRIGEIEGDIVMLSKTRGTSGKEREKDKAFSRQETPRIDVFFDLKGKT